MGVCACACVCVCACVCAYVSMQAGAARKYVEYAQPAHAVRPGAAPGCPRAARRARASSRRLSRGAPQPRAPPATVAAHHVYPAARGRPPTRSPALHCTAALRSGSGAAAGWPSVPLACLPQLVAGLLQRLLVQPLCLLQTAHRCHKLRAHQAGVSEGDAHCGHCAPFSASAQPRGRLREACSRLRVHAPN